MIKANKDNLLIASSPLIQISWFGAKQFMAKIFGVYTETATYLGILVIGCAILHIVFREKN